MVATNEQFEVVVAVWNNLAVGRQHLTAGKAQLLATAQILKRAMLDEKAMRVLEIVRKVDEEIVRQMDALEAEVIEMAKKGSHDPGMPPWEGFHTKPPPPYQVVPPPRPAAPPPAETPKEGADARPQA